jgi:predicted DNA-binding transcriptional regulator AlpA
VSAAKGRHLSVDDFCEEFGVARSTFYDWRAKGRAPKCHKLPNGEIRIKRTDADSWFNACEDL